MWREMLFWSLLVVGLAACVAHGRYQEQGPAGPPAPTPGDLRPLAVDESQPPQPSVSSDRPVEAMFLTVEPELPQLY